MLIEFNDKQVVIDLRMILRKDYSVENLQVAEDQLVLHYQGQEICFYATDGNDVLSPTLTSWIQMIQAGLGIPDSKISFLSISPSLSQWRWIPYRLEAFENIVTCIKDVGSIDRNTSQAKFIGTLIGSRWSVARQRLAYELDRAFPNDAFITYPKLQTTESQINEHVRRHYDAELTWTKNRQFDNDIDHLGIFDYRDAAQAYINLWNRFHIEIVVETDEYQNHWFTDKTAKCLHTGKPFLLLSGRHSLKNLKQMGFVTFDRWIDESYDECVLPGQRISAIINSLKNLYSNPNRLSVVSEMTQHAVHNTLHYYKYVQSKILLRTNT